jgi:pimeloyl-ACP methyl ester carboxylesterase
MGRRRLEVEDRVGFVNSISLQIAGIGRAASFGMAGYVDCLAGFIERLGLESPHVAGLSFGAALALEFYP